MAAIGASGRFLFTTGRIEFTFCKHRCCQDWKLCGRYLSLVDVRKRVRGPNMRESLSWLVMALFLIACVLLLRWIGSIYP